MLDWSSVVTSGPNADTFGMKAAVEVAIQVAIVPAWSSIQQKHRGDFLVQSQARHMTSQVVWSLFARGKDVQDLASSNLAPGSPTLHPPEMPFQSASDDCDDHDEAESCFYYSFDKSTIASDAPRVPWLRQFGCSPDRDDENGVGALCWICRCLDFEYCTSLPLRVTR